MTPNQEGAVDITLKTTVGGQLDPAAIKKAIDEAGPLEPETEYVLSISLARAPEPVAEGDGG